METASPAAKENGNGPAATVLSDPLPAVRRAVRKLLLSSPAFLQLDASRRGQMAEALVKVCYAAAALIREEFESDHQPGRRPTLPPLSRTQDVGNKIALKGRTGAITQSAGSEFSGVAAERVAGTTRAILNAVSFPRFVTELINGVFKALVDSNLQQMNSYVDLLNNVATSVEGFEQSNIGTGRARDWLAERYPGNFELVGDQAGNEEQPQPGEPPPERILQLRANASLPPPETLKADLGLGDDETVPAGDPERVLVPLARRALARQRQEMLATLVMLGMQRLVVESGRINAAMRFHIDTRSAAQEDHGSSFDFRNQLSASGSFGFGPWGASAAMTNTIGYVSTQRSQTTEEMNTDLDLNSSVELYFKTDYLPLDRMASRDKVDRIRVNTLNPEAEAKASADARSARAARSAESDADRRRSTNLGSSAPPRMPTVPQIAPKHESNASAPVNSAPAAKDSKPVPTSTDSANTNEGVAVGQGPVRRS